MKAKIHYYDIGDYLSQQEKLKIVKNFKSITNLPFVELHPNAAGDWINERNESFDAFIPLAPEKKFDMKTQSFFNTYTLGTATNRDHWVYNFSLKSLKQNIDKTINHYNEERKKLLGKGINNLEKNPEKGNWTRDWLNAIVKNKEFIVNNSEFRKTLYRPFCTINSYFDDDLNQERYQLTKFFPNNKLENLVIDVTGLGVNKDFTVLISDKIPDLQTLSNGQCFPLYYYEERQKQTQSLFDTEESGTSEYVRRDAISDFILDQAKERYGLKKGIGDGGRGIEGANTPSPIPYTLTKEDLFYYVYGLLHSKEYRETFANDLKKMLPRLPLLEDVRDFWAFSKAGRALAELHLNYENQPAAAGVIVVHNPLTITETLKQLSADEIKYIDYRVEKMKFPKKDQKETIYYNNRITIENIPAKAYDYVVNGKSAIEWIMERYAITTHKESQITNNPNDWAEEVGNPKYILELLLSVINVSVQTVDIVEGLPKVKF